MKHAPISGDGSLAGYDADGRRRLAMLTHAALDHVWSRGTCSPHRCPRCQVLRELRDLDPPALDEWVRGWPEPLADGSAQWWDADRQQVHRAWLARAWGEDG